MASSVLKHLILCSLLVIAASAFREHHLVQQLLNPSRADCRRSPFLVSLRLCDKYIYGQQQFQEGEGQGEQEAVEPVEQEAGEPVEQEAEEPVEQEAGEPGEQEAGEPVEQEASEPVEQEAMEPGSEQEAGAEQQELEPQANFESFTQQRLLGVHGGTSLCGPYRFTCQSVKKCVAKSRVCDGVDDCGDGSDERNCRFRPYRS